MYRLRFRQVHLDFHTSEAIENIGGAFDETQFIDALRAGHVDSITCFSKCHHGWSYHPTEVGKPHPHLATNLLQRQYDACKAADINVPIYISAGLDTMKGAEQPQWREGTADGQFLGGPVTHAHFFKMCFNSPYLDYLCEQIREVVELFPDCDGIFLDIIAQHECCCPTCLAWMHERGLDASDPAARRQCRDAALERYYQLTTEACRSGRDDMPVFHNSGHIPRGRRDILQYFSHLELESLPTGGWGYDHFPLSAKYCQNLPLDFLGMTGKFHTTWGEFGGYKHPDALRYECAAMLAFGSKCSVGDQLHPEGLADRTTYELIGAAYAEVQAKEPFCNDVSNVADVGLLSSEAVRHPEGREVFADIGASRVLLEGHVLFDVLDAEMDFDRYRVLVLPDEIVVEGELKAKLDAYLAAGGKLLLSGSSGIGSAGPIFDVGGTWEGTSEYQPDFVLPREGLRPDWLNAPLVMYLPSQRLRATDGESLGEVYDPYFNRHYKHFCSHQHAPARPEPSGFHAGLRKGNIVCLAHPVFSLYGIWGTVACKDFALRVLKLLLDEPTVTTSLPPTARVSLQHQPGQNRHVLHLLHAEKILEGGQLPDPSDTLARPPQPVEIIESLRPLRDTRVTVRLAESLSKVTLEPRGTELEFTQSGGNVELTVEEFTGHQMVVLHG